MKRYGLKNFILIASSYFDSDMTTMQGLEDRLKGWFCIKYNTTLNDPRLLDMCLEELIVHFQMDRIHKNPNVIEEVKGNAYEDWLKKEMGEDYISEEQMIELAEKEEKEYTKKVRDQFPDKVTTSFEDIK